MKTKSKLNPDAQANKAIRATSAKVSDTKITLFIIENSGVGVTVSDVSTTLNVTRVRVTKILREMVSLGWMYTRKRSNTTFYHMS